MLKYVLIESRDPFECRRFADACELARSLASEGAAVTVYLIENGVLAARGSATLDELDLLARAGVSIVADDFSMRERGIGAAELASGVQRGNLELLLTSIGMGARAIWN